MEISTNFNHFYLKRITDYISASIINYIENFRIIFKRVLLYYFITIAFTILLFFSYNGEFNLTFFISRDGKTFLVLITIFFLINQVNTFYQSIRIILHQNLLLRNYKYYLTIFAFIILKYILLSFLIILIYMNNAFIVLLMIYVFVNLYFYFFTFNFSMNVFGRKKTFHSLIDKLMVNIKAMEVMILNRVLIFLIPVIATFSIFIVYEFVLFMISGKNFFFMSERDMELNLFGIIFLMFNLILNPFQSFSLMFFYKYYRTK